MKQISDSGCRTPGTTRTMARLAGCVALLSASAIYAAADAPQESRSPSQVQGNAQARFQAMDKDADGIVSQAEFEAARPDGKRSEGKWKEHRHRMHARADTHHKGKALAGKHRRRMSAAINSELFDILDTDANGQLSRDEHARGNQPANRRLAHRRVVFKRLDKDGNGELSREEMQTHRHMPRVPQSD